MSAIGRPTEFTEDTAARMLAQIAEGRGLVSICNDADMPSTSTAYRWLQANADFRDRYERARDEQADTLADQILDIADDQSEDPQSRRVRMDARKWVASKLKPKKYGDKTTTEHTGGISVTWQPPTL